MGWVHYLFNHTRYTGLQPFFRMFPPQIGHQLIFTEGLHERYTSQKLFTCPSHDRYDTKPFYMYSRNNTMIIQGIFLKQPEYIFNIQRANYLVLQRKTRIGQFFTVKNTQPANFLFLQRKIRIALKCNMGIIGRISLVYL